VSNELQRIEPGGALEVRQPDDANPMSIIQFALEKGAGVEVIEKMMAVRSQLRAERAKSEYDSAMSAFQSECPTIVKNKDGYNKAYRFASLDHIVHETKPLLQKNGFSYSITSEISDGWVKAFCKVTHIAGHSETSEFKCPIDNNQKNLMSTPQRYGAAMTFTKRYAFCNAFGILTSDEDIDGGTKPEPTSPKKPLPEEEIAVAKGKLWVLCKPFRGEEKSWAVIETTLRSWKILDARTVAQLDAGELQDVIEKTKIQLNPEAE
jgi:hypothetical protein